MSRSLLVRATSVLLRLILLAYPRAFRRRFASEVMTHVTRELAEAERGGRAPRAALAQIAAALRDLAAEHLSEWRTHRAGPQPRRANGLACDLRLARRRLSASPLVAGIVVGTLGLAIGSSTAIFSVADAVLLRPLPYPASERIVRLDEQTAEASHAGVSLPAFELWTRGAPSLASLAFFEPVTTLVMIGHEPDHISGATSVSRAFFDVLAVRPAMGRPFGRGPLFGGPAEVIVSHALWQRLGGTEAVIGTKLFVDPRMFTIVGVMPPGFSYPDGAQFWASAGELAVLRHERSLRFMSAIGRLAPGADLDRLQAELDVLTARNPATDRLGGPVRMTAAGLRDSIVGQVRTGIVSAAAAVGLLLIVACCNVTALLLAQSSARYREHAVQAALGASRARLVRQEAVEVALLAAAGGGLGVCAASLCRDAIVALSLDEIPRIAGTAIDLRVLLFAVICTGGAALTATIVPSWLAARVHAADGLRAGSRSGGYSRPVLRILRVLVVAEVALTFVLAVAGVLLARTFERLARVDLGFSPEGVVSLRINLPLGALSRDAQRLFYEDVLERVRRLPGIESAGYSSRLPLSAGRASVETTRADRPGPEVRAIMQAASVGYLPTIGARLIGGRDFSPSDPVASPVVIVNDVLARQLYPEGDAAGRRIRFSLFGRPTDGTVIGVTRALRYNGLTAAASPELYMDYRVRPLMMLLVARTTMPLAESVPLLRSAIRQADASGRITVDQITSLDREIVKQLARPRFYLAMVGAFGLTALALATAGVYGVMSFAVAARRHDLGVRLALGASPTQIFQHTLRSGAVLTGLGLLMGGAGAFAGVTAIRSLLFGVQPRDPATFAAAAALVGAVAIGGCWIPARRARQTDPLAVVRAD